RAVQSHHIQFRSRGGGHEGANQAGMCAYHHLVGIHEGFMTVSGKAPDHLAWTASGRPFRAGAQDPPT
ncbi:MAG TPA: HNH endonuclease, partial [Anaeromyxobacteraceae bacterium]|nr:HNH endonuclease [Anaeromyxobacteraceae bacterium]